MADVEVITLMHKEYAVTERKDGTLLLKPIVRPTDKRNALSEYTDQELVDEMWERAEKALKQRKEDEEEWKNICVLDTSTM